MEKSKINQSLSVIGLGAMGAALAETLINKSTGKVTLWNRDSTKAKPLVAKGAFLADTPAHAISANQVTVICVSNYQAVNSIFSIPEVVEAVKGKTIVHLSTGTPKEARDMEKLVQSFGGYYIDGAILAWPSQIGHEETTILAAGEPAIFEQIQGILRSLAGNLTFMGADIAASSALFSAVLSYLAGEWIGFCHGALICEKEGLDVKSFGTLMHTLSPVLGAELAHMGQVIADDDFYKPESTLKTTGGDLIRLLQHSHEAGINDELPKFASSMFAKAIEAGYGGEEHAALIKVLR